MVVYVTALTNCEEKIKPVITLTWAVKRAQDGATRDKNQPPWDFLTENLEGESDEEDLTLQKNVLPMIQKNKRAEKERGKDHLELEPRC